MKVYIDFRKIYYEDPFKIEPIGPFKVTAIIKESEMILIKDYGLTIHDNHCFDIKDKDKFLIFLLTYPQYILRMTENE